MPIGVHNPWPLHPPHQEVPLRVLRPAPPATSSGTPESPPLQQDEGLQRDALQTAGCERIFVDKASGKLESRPALDDLLAQVRRGDTVVVWRLERLGRSLKHLIETVQDLEQRGVAFVSLTESIDTSTPGGRLIFRIFGALAEFERDLIRERTLAGLAAARARGRPVDDHPSGPRTISGRQPGLRLPGLDQPVRLEFASVTDRTQFRPRSAGSGGLGAC